MLPRGFGRLSANKAGVPLSAAASTIAAFIPCPTCVFLTTQNLKPYVGQDWVMIANQIELRIKKGVKAFGYAPNVLQKGCDLLARTPKVLGS